MMQKGTLFLSIVVIMAIAATGLYIWQNEQDKTKLLATITELTQPVVASPQPTVTPTTNLRNTTMVSTNSAEMATQGGQLANYGTMTGSLSFPSEIIPEMLICAESTTSEEEYCTNEQLTSDDYQYGLGYSIYLPTGEYLVYAKLPNDPYQAYYSEFVTCGLSVDCPSHQPIKVKVIAGETLANIDPQDWYNQQPEN